MLRLRRRALTDLVLLGLSLAGGTLDAVSFLAFGRVFTANMTGNTVVLAVSLADGLNAHALRAAVALGGYCIGTFAGALLIRSHGHWPAAARTPLALELLALAAMLALWAGVGVRSVRYELLVLGGAVMGLQSAAALASGVSGVNTTYMTGTLTNALARLAGRLRPGRQPRQGPALGGAAWITYGAGALAGAFAVRPWHAAVLCIPLAVLVVIAAMSWLQPATEEHDDRHPCDEDSGRDAGRGGRAHPRAGAPAGP